MEALESHTLGDCSKTDEYGFTEYDFGTGELALDLRTIALWFGVSTKYVLQALVSSK